MYWPSHRHLDGPWVESVKGFLQLKIRCLLHEEFPRQDQRQRANFHDQSDEITVEHSSLLAKFVARIDVALKCRVIQNHPPGNVWLTSSDIWLQVNDKDLVIVVSDLKPEDNTVVRTIQIRHVPEGQEKLPAPKK